ncbi:MAG: FAD-binding and (Fe-S)-binding domain-containing protein [Pseudomonadota bacterium]
MKTLSPTLKEQLRHMYGEWVSFDKQERRIYSHDVGVIPKLIRPLVGEAVAAAVVQPRTEQQLLELVRWATEHKIPLVPRAKATSGYGGVLPVKGGLSVNMTRMRKLIEIDRQAMTVRVEPGLVWEDLEQAITKQGLSLRTYPSSAPASTVGGWLAQGGVGYGGFEFGCFLDNVVSARVVLPTGETRVFEGDELELISDAEGITGFITEITLRVRDKQAHEVRAINFKSTAALADALNEILDSKLALWSVSFINPTMARLKNALPPRLEHGHPVPEPRPTLPEDGYIVLLVASTERWAHAEKTVDEIVTKYQGIRLDQSLAEHEWDERFNLMHIKRLGPSLLPAEAVVPLDALAPVLEQVQQAVKQPLTLEGMVQLNHRAGPKGLVTLLGFIPHDERSLAYGVAYALSLTLIRSAQKHGGWAYSTGFYFSSQANEVLGAERVRKLAEFKHKVDPQRIMNPRKVIDKGLIAHLLGAILPLEPLTRIPANLFTSPVGERIEARSKRGIPGDVAWYAYACAQCGYCVDECDQYYGRGWESESPRGRWFFLRDYMEGRANMTQEWVENFLACTTCEMCNVKCPLELPNESMWMKMRGELIQKQDKATFPPFEMMRASVRKELNIWGVHREDRAAWMTQDIKEKSRVQAGDVYFTPCSASLADRQTWLPDDVKDRLHDKAEIAYFAGCTASLVETDVAQGASKLLCAAGVDFTYLGQEEACCGIPMLLAGHWETFEQIMRHNIRAMERRGVKTVVTSCPACWLSWHTYYPDWAKKLGIPFDIKTRHYSEVLAERLASADLKFTREIPRKVTWHDSCHMGRAGGIYEPPRQLLQAIPGVELKEMEYNRENAHCCGSVLSLLEDPDGAAVNIGKVRLEEAVETGAEALIAGCPCCELQFRVTAKKAGIDLPIIDLAHIAAEGLGVSLPDPTDYALEQWKTFEAMIKLLKPAAMAEFMAGLLPQMIEVMPQPFRGMMKWMKNTAPTAMRDAMLRMMRPMMPVLFPRLLPGMMPKMMPDMLKAMEKVVPMPQYLKEQMPELMPEVMGNLLPKMLPEVIPHLVPRMEAYLKQR